MNEKNRSQLGIVGFGQFGQFMAKHLAPYFELLAYDIRDDAAAMHELGVQPATLKEIAKLPTIILAVPVQELAEVLSELVPGMNPMALVIDVSSVKVKPIRLMQQALPKTVEIIGTHPLFGPQSGKNGIAGLSIVVCPVRTTKATKIEDFLRDKLQLTVVEISPEEHDEQMAYVQGLSHLISRALTGLTLPETTLATKAYQELLSMAHYLGSDSEELFMTIERENPYAAAVRAQFLAQIHHLDRRITGNVEDDVAK